MFDFLGNFQNSIRRWLPLPQCIGSWNLKNDDPTGEPKVELRRGWSPHEHQVASDPKVLRKNEKLFLKKKMKKNKEQLTFSGFALSPSLARTLSAPSWVPAGKSLSNKRK